MRSAMRDRVGSPVDVLAQDGELVAAEARDGVLGAQRAAQPAGDVDESLSPAPWPSVSLTTLKPSRSRNSTATAGAAPRAGAGRRQPVAEQRAVGQAGQRVVQRARIELASAASAR